LFYFIIGDEFDSILGILEEEEELDEQFREAADEVSIRFFLVPSTNYAMIDNSNGF